MKRSFLLRSTVVVLTLLLGASTAARALNGDETEIRGVANAAVLPAMREYDIPGMAVAVVLGERRYVFNYGVVSSGSREPVTDATLFEIGSISKTFTATLAALAHARQLLSLNDKIEAHMPSLKGTPIGATSILHLATHSAGGFALQLPAGIEGEQQLTAYYRSWSPSYAAGTQRTYANPSVGLLGLIAAKSMDKRFAVAVRDNIFQPIGMNSTFYEVPTQRLGDYAQGYTKQGEPARMESAALSDEAYGVKITASDLLRFVEANLGQQDLDPALRQAIAMSHEGHLKVNRMTQDLIWEQYDCPVEVRAVLDGSSSRMTFGSVPATWLMPPQAPRPSALLVKSGSTNGFGAYVAFVPASKAGVVIIANKNYAIEERVRIAWSVLAKLESMQTGAPADRPAACTRDDSGAHVPVTSH